MRFSPLPIKMLSVFLESCFLDAIHLYLGMAGVLSIFIIHVKLGGLFININS